MSKAYLALASGEVIKGKGHGALGTAVGELCFNTAMTGYQEILTDPSYARQIITFTFPHIGNVGCNDQDNEHSSKVAEKAAIGAVFRMNPTEPSNWRSTSSLETWLANRNIIGLSGIDTRGLTRLLRQRGMQNACIAHVEDDEPVNETDLVNQAKQFQGIDGADLVPDVTTREEFLSQVGVWKDGAFLDPAATRHLKVVVLDFGVKRNILRHLVALGCEVVVVPGTTSAQDILALKPDGVFLSNGPGDPDATGKYAVKTIRELLERNIPLFGICLGHQLLALAMGAKTVKMHQGHHGANHPVLELATGKVEIVSMNHGFTVDAQSLTQAARETHRSLFDESNCGLELLEKPAFSVQYHPEASPGPQDSLALFKKFVQLMEEHKGAILELVD